MKVCLYKFVMLFMCIIVIGLMQSVTVYADAEDKKAVLMDAVTVTANKREQKSFDVSGNIDVVTEEDLRRSAITQTDQLDSVFPELSIMERGSRLYSNMTLRGKSGLDFYTPNLGVFVDGVPQMPQMHAQSLQRVGQVDLLKGVQGSIYGRGTLSGVMNIVTRKPSEEMEVWVDGHFSNLDGSGSLGMSTGYSDSGWALQASCTADRAFGYLDDPNTSPTSPAYGRKDVNTNEMQGGLVSLHYRSPAIPLESRVKLSMERYQGHDEFFVDLDDLSDKVLTDADFWLFAFPDLTRKAYSMSWDAQYALSDNWELSGVAAYQSVKNNRISLDKTDTLEKQKNTFVEAKLAYTGDDLTGLMGLSFEKLSFYHQVQEDGAIGMGGELAENDVDSYSAYFDGIYRFHPMWEVGAGLRFSHEIAKADMRIKNIATGVVNTFSDDAAFTSILPRASLTLLPNKQNRIWASFGYGFKPGGFSKVGAGSVNHTAYESETAAEFELGWKWQSVDSRFRSELTGYFTDSKDVQAFVGTPGHMYLKNVGDADYYGLEYKLLATVTEGHVFSIGGMLSESRFTSGKYEDKDLPYAPSYTVLVAWDGLFGADDEWAAHVQSKTTGPYSWLDIDQEQSAYTLVDASLTWSPAGKGFEVGVYAKNIFDTKYATSAFPNSWSKPGAQVGSPREFGLRTSVYF